ncbi:MerR family transcriptional regulator [Faecalimonas sp.]
MKKYYHIGEISKLYHIGADSLRYYETLGILSPTRSETGYRLYSLNDLWRLNVIRDLRSLGFSMEQIKTYLNNRTIHSTKQLLTDELAVITEKLQALTNLKENVEERLRTVQEAILQPIGEIRKIYYKRRYCHIVHSPYKTDEEMDMLIKQLLNKDNDRLYIIGNNRIGSSIPMESICKKLFCDYTNVFIIDRNGKEYIEEGDYLTICYKGKNKQNEIYIPKLFQYAEEYNLIPTGPILELLWIDIHQSKNTDEHITELQVRCLQR